MVRTAARLLGRGVTALTALALLLVAFPARAPAAPPQSCSIIGYTAPDADAARRLRERLANQQVNDLTGVQLGRTGTWKIPSGSVPVVVVESTEPLTAGSATMSVLGLSFGLASGSGGAKRRYVSDTTLPLLGSVTRTIKIEGHGDGCAGSVTLLVERGPYSTVGGLGGVVLAVVAGVLAMLFACRRRAGRLSRILLGGGFGLLAGLGEALVMHENGVIAPDSARMGIGPLAGLLLGALVARPWRGRPPSEPTPLAALDGYQPVAEVDRDDSMVRYTAVDPATDTRVLLTTVRPDAEDPREAGERFDRHVEVLRRLAGERLPRFRALFTAAPESVAAEPGYSGAQLVAATVLVTEPELLTTARRHLDGGQRFTGEQAATVVHDALTGLTALHAAGLAHGDIGPQSIHLTTEGAMLGAFSQTREGEPDRDLHLCGLLLADLLVGEVPPAMAALVERVTAADPSERPRTAEVFRDELDEAAGAAYGPDWMTVGAITGAILVPAAAIVATGSFAAVTASAVGTGVSRGLGTATTIGKATVSKATVALPAVVSGAVAVLVAVTTTVAAPKPAAAAADLLDPARARIIAVSTWAEARTGDKAHVADSLTETLANLLKLPGVGSANLSDLQIGIPHDQRGYPAYFVVTATAKLSDGRTLYLIGRFARPAADQPWKLQKLHFNTDRLKVPVPAIDPDGYLAPTPVGDLVLDPATLSQRYVDWGRKIAASNQLNTDDLLELGPDAHFLVGTAENANAHDTNFFSTHVFATGAVEPGIVLADGSVLVWFTVNVTVDSYNRPRPASGDCRFGSTTLYLYFNPSHGGSADEHYRQLHMELILAVEARVPVKNGKATIVQDDFHYGPHSGVPC